MWEYNQNELYHFGIKGMKWGVRRFQNQDGSLKPKGKQRYDNSNAKNITSKYDDNDIRVKSGSDVHRIIPKGWVEKEKGYKGHAYASYKPEDTKRYKDFAKMFDPSGNNYVDMRFKVTKDLVSPSLKKRVDTFIELIDKDPKFKESMIKATRTPLLFTPKSTFDKLGNEKKLESAYRKMAYLVVSKRDIRDPYFNALKKKGYNMMLDDADIKGGISKEPIIIFDREKNLKLKDVNKI